VSVDEFEIIGRFFDTQIDDPDVLLGPGDDAAIVKPRSPIAVAADTLVAGVHFPVELAPADVGYRVLAVNLSDMAAMGARPRWMTLALTIESADLAWLESFSEGLLELARDHGVALIGGDLTRGPLTVSVQIIGDIDPDRALTRAGACVGDEIYVTGSIGGAAAGLTLIQRGDSDPANVAIVERFKRPLPRVEAGLALRGIASAGIDVSDGLYADLSHLCERSGCGAVIDVDNLPVMDRVQELFSFESLLQFALHGGDDYELCFTAARSAAASVERSLRQCGVDAARIGRIVAGRDVACMHRGHALPVSPAGFKHF
jgi:thiamine-monophosphate kinase